MSMTGLGPNPEGDANWTSARWRFVCALVQFAVLPFELHCRTSEKSIPIQPCVHLFTMGFLDRP